MGRQVFDDVNEPMRRWRERSGPVPEQCMDEEIPFTPRLDLFLEVGKAAVIVLFSFFGVTVSSPAGDFQRIAETLRKEQLLRISPKIVMSPASQPAQPNAFGSFSGGGGHYPWHERITVTCFNVGEKEIPGLSPSNCVSAWDPAWLSHAPHQNPFYVALPYNDVIDSSHFKPEAPKVVPWFHQAFIREGQSVCQGRWVELRKGNRRCFAQWADCGPFCTTDSDYVFGRAQPRPNRNQNAGIDVSPAVQQFLDLSGIDQCSWRFVETREVVSGPWYVDKTLAISQNEMTRDRTKSR